MQRTNNYQRACGAQWSGTVHTMYPTTGAPLFSSTIFSSTSLPPSSPPRQEGQCITCTEKRCSRHCGWNVWSHLNARRRGCSSSGDPRRQGGEYHLLRVGGLKATPHSEHDGQSDRGSAVRYRSYPLEGTKHLSSTVAGRRATPSGWTSTVRSASVQRGQRRRARTTYAAPIPTVTYSNGTVSVGTAPSAMYRSSVLWREAGAGRSQR